MHLTTYSDVFIRDIFKYYSRTGLSKMIIKPVFIYYCMSTIYRVIYENFINVVVASMDRIIFDCLHILRCCLYKIKRRRMKHIQN